MAQQTVTQHRRNFFFGVMQLSREKIDCPIISAALPRMNGRAVSGPTKSLLSISVAVGPNWQICGQLEH